MNSCFGDMHKKQHKPKQFFNNARHSSPKASEQANERAGEQGSPSRAEPSISAGYGSFPISASDGSFRSISLGDISFPISATTI
jgi:hypothetical protein